MNTGEAYDVLVEMKRRQNEAHSKEYQALDAMIQFYNNYLAQKIRRRYWKRVAKELCLNILVFAAVYLALNAFMR